MMADAASWTDRNFHTSVRTFRVQQPASIVHCLVGFVWDYFGRRQCSLDSVYCSRKAGHLISEIPVGPACGWFSISYTIN